MNQRVIITRGLSGSGKTTWSKEFVKNNPDYVRVSRDDLNFMLNEGEYTPKLEETVFLTRDVLIDITLDQGYNLVLDETYLVPERIKRVNEVLTTYVYGMERHLDISIQDFIDVPLEKCIARDEVRHFHVGEAFIRTYHKKYVLPLLQERGITQWTL